MQLLGTEFLDSLPEQELHVQYCRELSFGSDGFTVFKEQPGMLGFRPGPVGSTCLLGLSITRRRIPYLVGRGSEDEGLGRPRLLGGS